MANTRRRYQLGFKFKGTRHTFKRKNKTVIMFKIKQKTKYPIKVRKI